MKEFALSICCQNIIKSIRICNKKEKLKPQKSDLSSFVLEIGELDRPLIKD